MALRLIRSINDDSVRASAADILPRWGLLFNALLNILAGKPDIIICRAVERCHFLGSERAHDFARIPKYQRMGRDLRSRGHHRAGADQTFFSHFSPVQDNRAHADQGEITNGAGMDHDIMGDRHAVPKNGWDATAKDMNSGVCPGC